MPIHLPLATFAGVVLGIYVLNRVEKGIRAGEAQLPNGRVLRGRAAIAANLVGAVLAIGLIGTCMYVSTLLPG